MSLLSVTVTHMFLLCVTVKYMSLLCRYMLESVRSMSQHLEGVDAEVSVGSGARGSKRSREDKRQVSSRAVHVLMCPRKGCACSSVSQKGLCSQVGSNVSQKGLCKLVLVDPRNGCVG